MFATMKKTAITVSVIGLLAGGPFVGALADTTDNQAASDTTQDDMTGMMQGGQGDMMEMMQKMSSMMEACSAMMAQPGTDMPEDGGAPSNDEG